MNFRFVSKSVTLNDLERRDDRYLWSPYRIGQTIYIFMLWFVLLSSSSFLFPRLISAAADWMSAILPHMVWP